MSIIIPEIFQPISKKILNGERITAEEALKLYQADLPILGYLANHIREKLHGKRTYFIRNFHIEPTNICIHHCRFCSYSARVTGKPWEHTIEKMKTQLHNQKDSVSEVHITGGVHPDWEFSHYVELIKALRLESPKTHIKAFSAVEIFDMCSKADITIKDGLQQLITAGLDALPGGGAEIFESEIREKICRDKISGDEWLFVHEIAHKLGIASNATMLYGHIENISHRIDHLEKLRNLQDKTGGFGCFIPLKYKQHNNPMSSNGEVSIIEDIKTFAISRIFLDNFSHIKAYWPMLGRETAQLMLSFGVDDLDGTINDSTEIYTRAGSDESNPEMSVLQLKNLIETTGKEAIERFATAHNV